MTAQAGTYESCDCKITIQTINEPNNKITIESIVFEQFGDDIFRVISTLLSDNNITNCHIHCLDKGALDYTIKSRTLTALKRGGYIE